MTESKSEEPTIPLVETLDPEWRRAIAEQLEASFFYYGQVAEIITLGPDSLSGFKLEEDEKVDSRGWWQLNPAEQEHLKQALFRLVGFDPSNTEIVTSYKTQVVLNPEENTGQPAQEIDIFVYSTDRSGEDIFIHEMRNAAGQPIEYFVAPKDKQI